MAGFMQSIIWAMILCSGSSLGAKTFKALVLDALRSKLRWQHLVPKTDQPQVEASSRARDDVPKEADLVAIPRCRIVALFRACSAQRLLRASLC